MKFGAELDTASYMYCIHMVTETLLSLPGIVGTETGKVQLIVIFQDREYQQWHPRDHY